MQKPILAGLPAAVSASAARPTTTPVQITRYLFLFM